MPEPGRLSSPAALAVRAGLAEYRAGRFHSAHERWEAAWRVLAGDERRCVQGLILVAGAACHIERGRDGVARRLLLRAADVLAPPVAAPGLADVGGLGARVRAAAASDLPLPPVALDDL